MCAGARLFVHAHMSVSTYGGERSEVDSQSKSIDLATASFSLRVPIAEVTNMCHHTLLFT